MHCIAAMNGIGGARNAGQWDGADVGTPMWGGDVGTPMCGRHGRDAARCVPTALNGIERHWRRAQCGTNGIPGDSIVCVPSYSSVHPYGSNVHIVKEGHMRRLVSAAVVIIGLLVVVSTPPILSGRLPASR
jgi:hypothetical protein